VRTSGQHVREPILVGGPFSVFSTPHQPFLCY
jgi:hypothetical protein